MTRLPAPAAFPRAALRGAVFALALGGLAGCGAFDSVSDAAPEVQVSVLEPSANRPSQRTLTTVEELRPVDTVERLELGGVYGGLVLTAYGTAPGGGWFAPTLAPRREGLPGPDGFIEFDMQAAPPELNGGAAVEAASPRARAIRADAEIPRATLAGAVGLRVHAARGAKAISLAPPPAAPEG